MKKFIDLSISIENDLPSDPPYMIPEITYLDHEYGANQMSGIIKGLDSKKDLPDGLGWAVEVMNVSSHAGTHIDAPWHYHPTMNNGEKALTIDTIPLEWCMGNGVKLDFTHFEDGYLVTAKDMEEAFEKIDYDLKSGDIVLVNTGADKYWGRPEYLGKGCGMGKDATLWLCERGIHLVGTDAWSWDRPLSIVAKEYLETKDSSIIWEGHFAGIEKGYCHIEKLTNLEKLPDYGFTLCCFPIKIKDASAGWIRAVAIIDD